MIVRIILLLTCAASAAGQLKSSSVLVAFPEITYDEHRAYFLNDTWAAVYSGQLGAMFTVPRDSVDVRIVDDGRTCRTIVGNATYSCHPTRGDALIRQDAAGGEDKVITPPSRAALQVLADAWHLISISATEIQEEIGPLIADGERIWFGLIAHRGQDSLPLAGLGWYDTRLDQFGRVYGSGLAGVAPRWVGVRQDTVWMYCKTLDKKHPSALISYSPSSATMMYVDPRGAGIPGDTLLNVSLARNALLISTEQAVCVWQVGVSPWVWQTDAYAARDSVWLQFLTFDRRREAVRPHGDFFPLAINQPAQAFTRVGDWIEVLAPRGIEARMDYSAWDKRSKALEGFDWGCGDSVCVARVRVQVQGATKEMDLLNTPIIFLERDRQEAKVGIQAGWVRVDQVVPVLMKK